MDIHWYPGHMTKARRLMEAQLKAIDVVIEVVDARIPCSSRNPDLDDLFGRKRRLVLLNKADLADENATRAWVAYFTQKGWQCFATTATQKDARKQIVAGIDRVMKAEVLRLLEKKGLHKTVRAMIVGIPNVGKSAIINCLAPTAVAKTGNRPGVTRGNQLIRVTPYLELVDTPGVLWPKIVDPVWARHLAYVGSMRDPILDIYGLSLQFLEEMAATHPEAIKTRYKLDALPERPEDMLFAIGKARGLLRTGGQIDEERASMMVLTEFRSGKWGRITLEMPEDIL